MVICFGKSTNEGGFIYFLFIICIYGPIIDIHNIAATM